MKTVCIIPARGGSKGVPGKNKREMFGKPLVQWSVESALQSSLIDRTLISTDDEEIADIAVSAGAESPFMRPRDLAIDTATTESAMLHALDWLLENESYTPDLVVLLQPTSPIRKAGSIDRAIEKMFSDGADSLLSVAEFHHFLWKTPESPEALYNFQNRPRRQDIDPSDYRFRENGSIYVTRHDTFRTFGNRLGGKISMYVQSEAESIEIDTELDWALVEAAFGSVQGDIA